jgi:predicted ArsR family transcriptional regulator
MAGKNLELLGSTLGRPTNLELRRRILMSVAGKQGYWRTIPRISRRLSVSPTIVTNHMRSMEDMGLVYRTDEFEKSEGRGRPSQVWGLTEDGATTVEQVR